MSLVLEASEGETQSTGGKSPIDTDLHLLSLKISYCQHWHRLLTDKWQMIWLKFCVWYLAKDVSASSPVKGCRHHHWASQGILDVEDGSCVTSSVNIIIINQSCANPAVAVQSWFIEFEGDQLNWSRRSTTSKQECTLLHHWTLTAVLKLCFEELCLNSVRGGGQQEEADMGQGGHAAARGAVGKLNIRENSELGLIRNSWMMTGQLRETNAGIRGSREGGNLSGD